jgi:integrase
LGLRLSEALNLRVGDIDASREQAHMRNGKGHKDRFIVLRWPWHVERKHLKPQVSPKTLRHNGARPHSACICGKWQSIGLQLREQFRRKML